MFRIGYDNTMNKRRSSSSSPLACWEGYERVPGTKEYSKGSCRKKAPLAKREKPPAPSKKKSLGYYNKANKTGTGTAAGGGMSQKGVNKYKKDNPGSNLQTAVTTPPSELKKGSKDAKRRKSFCARSKGWTGERGRAARRRWNC